MLLSEIRRLEEKRTEEIHMHVWLCVCAYGHRSSGPAGMWLVLPWQQGKLSLPKCLLEGLEMWLSFCPPTFGLSIKLSLFIHLLSINLRLLICPSVDCWSVYPSFSASINLSVYQPSIDPSSPYCSINLLAYLQSFTLLSSIYLGMGDKSISTINSNLLFHQRTPLFSRRLNWAQPSPTCIPQRHT